MDFLTLLIISFSLTLDTFAVSVTTGLIINHIKFRSATRIALILAMVQALMPLIGWLVGSLVKNLIMDFDHWIAFGLLTLLGIKMIWEGMKHPDERQDFNPSKFSVLLGMAIATSIDALIVGVSFGLVETNITLAVIMIGAMTYIVAMLGMLFGKLAGSLLGQRMEIVGGLCLIGIGVKILLEHFYWCAA